MASRAIWTLLWVADPRDKWTKTWKVTPRDLQDRQDTRVQWHYAAFPIQLKVSGSGSKSRPPLICQLWLESIRVHRITVRFARWECNSDFMITFEMQVFFSLSWWWILGLRQQSQSHAKFSARSHCLLHYQWFSNQQTQQLITFVSGKFTSEHFRNVHVFLGNKIYESMHFLAFAKQLKKMQ